LHARSGPGVKEKEGIEDPKAWITPEEADAFLVNMHPNCSPGTRMEL